jgi:crotonobetainyl-CoA:carnitine CoA-transferase CaiB-like acyl-CoA transferase
LSGLRVLDLSEGRAAAWCTRWLAGFGAEVITVEDPGGSPLRAEGPFAHDLPDAEGGVPFLGLAGGKKSVTLDLGHSAAPAIVLRLAGVVDVLVEDRGPGVLAGLGLGSEALRARNPGLVHLSLTNFGEAGPYREYPATDLTLQAFSGTLHDRVIGGRNPVRMGGSQGAAIAGRVAFIAVLGAVLQREATGAGQQIDCSAVEAIAGNDLAGPTTYSYNGIVHQPRRTPAARGRAGLGRYPCKDGFVDVMPGVGGLKKLAALLGDPGLAEHELFTDHALRAKNAERFDAEFMRPWFEERTRDEIVEAAQALGMPFSYSLTVEELLDDPQLRAREFFVTVEHPGAGAVAEPGPPARLSRGGWATGPAPRLGSGNGEVLGGELGYSGEELGRLREQGVI